MPGGIAAKVDGLMEVPFFSQGPPRRTEHTFIHKNMSAHCSIFNNLHGTNKGMPQTTPILRPENGRVTKTYLFVINQCLIGAFSFCPSLIIPRTDPCLSLAM